MRAIVRMGEYLWRPLTDADSDAAFVVSLRNNERFRPMFYDAAEVTPQKHRAFVNSPGRRDEINWVIEKDSQPMGLAGMYHFDRDNRKAECGRIAMLAPRLFPMNYVVSAFMAFDVMRLYKLYMETLEVNETVARGVERLGMVREGLLRNHVVRDGKPVNVLYFGGTCEDWQSYGQARYQRWGKPELVEFDGWEAR
jgi:RimJ/RimL family protein N-acetyltransferase